MLNIIYHRSSVISDAEHHSVVQSEGKLIPDMGQQKHIIFLLFITICHSLLWTWTEGFIAKCYHKIPPPYSRNNIKYVVIDSAMHLHCIIYHCCFCFLVSKIGILEYINRSKRRKVFLRSEVLFPVFFLWALSVYYTALMRPGNLSELPVCCVCNCDVHKNHRNMDKLTFHAPALLPSFISMRIIEK